MSVLIVALRKAPVGQYRTNRSSAALWRVIWYVSMNIVCSGSRTIACNRLTQLRKEREGTMCQWAVSPTTGLQASTITQYLQMDLACSMYQTNTLAMKESALLCPCVWRAWCQDKQKDLETAMNTESQQTVIIDAV